MKNLEKLKNRLENENGFDELLAEMAGVDDYYSENYNKSAGDGFDFDLMYDIDEDRFSYTKRGEGALFEQYYNMIKVGDLEDAIYKETLVQAVEYYIELNRI